MDNQNKNIEEITETVETETTNSSETVEIETIDTTDTEDMETVCEKPKKKVKKERMRSEFSFKYGSFATAITAIFIVAVILVNIVVSVFNNNFPMTIDVTADKAYSVNPENEEFLRDLDYKVELNVVFTEEMYEQGAFSSLQPVTDNSGGKYYKQTVELLNQYHKYNKNISVNFLDPWSDAGVAITEEYAEHDPEGAWYGDIIVKCYPNGENKEPKLGLIEFQDCYELEDDGTSYYTGSENYTLAGNNIEQAVANGIFKTVNLEDINTVVVTSNSTNEYVTYFADIAKENAINLEYCQVIEDFDFSKFDVMMICSPAKDYTAKEIETISNWLDNDGKQGKTLLFFASAASPNLPNLYSLLEEWGIEYQRGYKYYSQDDNYYSTDRTNIYLESLGTDYTSSVDSGSYTYISNNMVPLNTVYTNESNGSRSVEAIMATYDMSAYKRPNNTPDWKPEGSGSQEPAILLSKNEIDGTASYVVGFSSVDFITNDHIVTKSENGNLRALVNIINTTARNDQDQYVMETKVITDSSTFTGVTNQAQTVIVAIVFIGVIPLSLIALAIYIYIKRKNY